MRTIAAGVTVLFLCVAVSADAQDAVGLTLEDAIARAIRASHRLAEIEARRDASQAAVDARRAADRPLVSLQAGYTRTNHVTEFSVPGPTGQPRLLYPDVPDNVRTRIDLQWPIYTGGRGDALERAAAAEGNALAQDRSAAQADLKLEVTRTYWALVTAQASAQVLADALTGMEGHLRDVRNRLNVGLIPPNDVLSTEAQRSRQQMLLFEARNLVESTATELRRLTGMAPDALIDIDATLAPPLDMGALPDALVDRARSARPERMALDIRAQSAAEREKAAAAGRLPALAVTGGYDYARPNPRIFPRAADWMASWDISMNMNWALWDGGRVKADVAEASANRRAAEQRLREFDAMLLSEIRQRRLDLASALAEIGSAEAGMRSATEARRVVMERYANGVATNTDVLDAQLAMMQAGLDRTRAIAGARLAEARLERALGQ